jgi:ribosomal protein S19
MPFTKHHMGFKLGEFGITRKPFNFPSKDKKTKR